MGTASDLVLQPSPYSSSPSPERDAQPRAAPLSLDAYQAAAIRTCTHERGSLDQRTLSLNALGVAGEAGEVADLVKKHVGHGHPLDRDKLAKELGDVLWYVAALAHDVGLDLSTVAALNIEKLKRRYPDGFSTERSINRVDVTGPDGEPLQVVRGV